MLLPELGLHASDLDNLALRHAIAPTDTDDLSVTFGEKSSGVTSVGALDDLRLLPRGRVSPIANFRGFPANVPGGGLGLVEPEEVAVPAEPVGFRF